MQLDWNKIAEVVLTSRLIDDIEENELYPQKKVLYQFSARGHELAQAILGSLLTNTHDAVGAYYRSRPTLLALGLSVEEAFAADMARSGSYSDGRDIGVVCNFPNQNGAKVLPMSGDVGSQYTPCVGWAQSITYRAKQLKESAFEQAIACVLGGEGSVATNGFWSSLTIATTLKLPLLFFIEDNGYAISVTGEKQTPGANIAKNLASFSNLEVIDGDGSNPQQAAALIEHAVSFVRNERSPALIRLTVPRLAGHSGQDTQAYKSAEILKAENELDPLARLQSFLVPEIMTAMDWNNLQNKVTTEVRSSLEKALKREDAEPDSAKRFVFCEHDSNGKPVLQKIGGLMPENFKFSASTEIAQPEPTRINMLTAIRRTLEHELNINPRLVVFGEDVGQKGGVHAATMGLQEKFGEERVFDTSLSEEGIVGRAVGMAYAGLMPVAEIQFRKYADPATEQLNNCGTIRWRTANQWAAPIVVRMPGGFFKCGDPWHSVSGEAIWAHTIGWQVAIPSNAEDAVGLLRSAMRSNNPTIFFEHRSLLDGVSARKPYPGDDFVIPFGKAKLIQQGTEVTVVSWGAMLERAIEAVKAVACSADIIDLRTIIPWDKDAILESVKKTRRLLIVHEDGKTCGFGAEISSAVAEEAFLNLDAPIMRVCTEDIPIPYNVRMMESVVPSVEKIVTKLTELIEF